MSLKSLNTEPFKAGRVALTIEHEGFPDLTKPLNEAKDNVVCFPDREPPLCGNHGKVP